MSAFASSASASGLRADIATLLDEAEDLTRHNTGLTLVVAFNYGGRQEIVRAVRALAEQVRAGTARSRAIDVEAVERALDTRGIPDPDLVIRTSGEQRVSNFLPWQTAYSEFVFLPDFWPDFDDRDLPGGDRRVWPARPPLRRPRRPGRLSMAAPRPRPPAAGTDPAPTSTGIASSELGEAGSVSAIVLMPLALGAAYLGGWPFALLWLAAGIAALVEWTDMAQRRSPARPFRRVAAHRGSRRLSLMLIVGCEPASWVSVSLPARR